MAKKIPLCGGTSLPLYFLNTANIRRIFRFSKYKAHFFYIFFAPIYKRGRVRSIRAGGLGGGRPSRAERLTRHQCADIGARWVATPRRISEGVQLLAPAADCARA